MLVAAAVFAGVPEATASTVTFEDLPLQTAVSDQYADSHDVTFSTCGLLDPGASELLVAGDQPSQFGSVICPGDSNWHVRAQFGAAHELATLRARGPDGPFFVRAFAADGRLLEESGPHPAGNTFVLVALRAPVGIVNVQVQTATRIVHVDDVSLAPDTRLTAIPPAVSGPGVSFDWASDQREARFECRLDGQAFGPCTSELSNLRHGPHVFRVRAVDEAGLSDPSPAAFSWQVDTAPPEITIGAPAQGATYQTGQAVTADYGCADEPGGSGVASCAGPIAAATPLDTATEGARAFTVTTTDRLGNRSSLTHTYNIAGPEASVAAPPSSTGTEGGGVLPPVDNCLAPDADGDRIGDACEILPNGNVPAVAAENVIVADVRGDVFVKLPRTRAALAGFRALFEDPGFVPLKGVASLPMGSLVDARKGSLSLQSAANSRPAADPLRRTQQARLAAGIFRIRQARLRRRLSRPIPTDLQLVSGVGAERACRGSTRRRPRKAVVRSLTIGGRGFFRALGGASVGTSQNGTWITTDRCDGTLTEVGRGSVRVRDPRRSRAVSVRAGRGFFVKRPQFLALKGRAPA